MRARAARAQAILACAAFLGLAAHAYETLPGVTRAVAGTYGACAVAAGGALYCWGPNYFGEVGDGTTQPRTRPVRVSGLDRPVVDVAIGDGHACALLDSGGVRCWGRNEAGDLGYGTYTARAYPARDLALPTIKSIAAGEQFACALSTAGTVYCWGDNVLGTLGNGTTQGSARPLAIPSLTTGVASLSAGGNHACALMQTGTVRCWGENNTGQLGDGTLTNSSLPVDVQGLGGPASQISASAAATCAIMADGRMLCWGLERGVPIPFTGPVSHAPIQVGVTGEFVSVRAGDSNVCAVRASGSAVCWGDNSYGELGVPDDGGSNVPVTLPSSIAWRDITPGDQTVCGVGVDSVAYCWGIWRGGGGFDVTPAPVYFVASGNYAPNVQDLWWGGTSENGWGLSIAQHQDMLFAGLYVYDAQGRPTWFVMSGGSWNADNTAFEGALYHPHGTPWQQYDASRLAIGAAVGSLKLQVVDFGHLTMTATIDGVATVKSITRQSFGATAGVVQMLWGGTAQNGWGVALARQGEKGFAVWYTYDDSGNPTWFVMSDSTSSFVSSTNGWRYQGTAYSTSGAPWIGANYGAGALQVRSVGALSLEFDHVFSQAQMTAAIGGATRVLSLVLQPF